MKSRTILPLLATALLAAGASGLVRARPAAATLGTSALPEGTEPYGPEVLLAKEDSVPVRTEPGFVYRELRFLKKGQEVVIDGRKGAWLHVRPQGWILAEHLVTREQAARPEPAKSVFMQAVRDNVRVRKSPSTDAEVVRTLGPGDEVETAGQEAGWWKLADGTGYVASALLRPAADELPEDESGVSPWVVSAESANVRAERNTTAAVVRKLSRGDVVAVSGMQEGWAQVPDGWVRADLLQAPAPRDSAPRRASAMPRPEPGDGSRRWSLVDLNGVIFEITDISRSGMLGAIKKEMRDTGVLEDDWTFLGLTIGVPEDAAYRFNYAPDRNTTIVTDVDGQKYGNVYVKGPFERLPAQVRQFFVPMTVNQGEKFDALLLFKPSLKSENIREISMFIGGRMQRLYEEGGPRH